MQWLQNSTRSNIVNLNTVRSEDSRLFRKKRKKCLKAKIDKHEIIRKIKLSHTCTGHQ